MSTFIPHQQKTIKDYVRWTTITAFVLVMLWCVSFFYEEYQQAKHNQQLAKTQIEKIEQANKAAGQTAKTPPISEPTGGGPMPPPPPPQLPKTTPKEAVDSVPGAGTKTEAQNSRFEIDAGLVKIAMDNEASWAAIFKIVFTLLFTFFGIKAINFGFKRLEGTVST